MVGFLAFFSFSLLVIILWHCEIISTSFLSTLFIIVTKFKICLFCIPSLYSLKDEKSLSHIFLCSSYIESTYNIVQIIMAFFLLAIFFGFQKGCTNYSTYDVRSHNVGECFSCLFCFLLLTCFHFYDTVQLLVLHSLTLYILLVQKIVRLFVITLNNPLPDGSSISKIKNIFQIEISFRSQIIL